MVGLRSVTLQDTCILSFEFAKLLFILRCSSSSQDGTSLDEGSHVGRMKSTVVQNLQHSDLIWLRRQKWINDLFGIRMNDLTSWHEVNVNSSFFTLIQCDALRSKYHEVSVIQNAHRCVDANNRKEEPNGIGEGHKTKDFHETSPNIPPIKTIG